MKQLSSKSGKTTRQMRLLGRVLGLLWAAWWLFFGLASGWHEGLDLWGFTLQTTLPGLAFLISVLFAWRWESIGGLLLVFEGLLILIIYPIMLIDRFPQLTIYLLLLTMAIPPIAAGLLHLVCWARSGAPGSYTG